MFTLCIITSHLIITTIVSLDSGPLFSLVFIIQKYMTTECHKCPIRIKISRELWNDYWFTPLLISWPITDKWRYNPKHLKILSWLTHPQVVLNIYAFLSSVEHKRTYFEGNLATTQSQFPFIWNCLVTNIFQNIFFYVPQKKESHTRLEQYRGESVREFISFRISHTF